MAYCLPQSLASKFIAKLKSGEISPDKLVDMTSKERNEFFTEFLGEANGKQVNALFESKLLLKDQVAGIVRWAKQVSGLNPVTQRDIINKVQKMEEILTPENEDMFFFDLAERKLGLAVDVEQAQLLSDLAQDVKAKKEAITPDMPVGHKARVDYGTASIAFEKLWGDLKTKANKKGVKYWLTHPWKGLLEFSGISKAIKASWDISFSLRQGVKAAYGSWEQKKAWGRAFKSSLKDFSKALVYPDVLDAVRGEIKSRPYALDGTYTRGKFDLNIKTEEEIPSTAPQLIPVLGRLFRASEVAYNSMALRLRADLADMTIRNAEMSGIDITDKDEIRGIGRFVNSLTGRGDIGKMESLAGELNVLLFSAKFLKGNIDTLTKPFRFNRANTTAFEQKQSAYALLRVIGHVAMLLLIADAFDDDAVNWDVTSSDFAKIKVGDTRFDITGGMGSIAILGARLAVKIKEGLSGEQPAFGERTGVDILNDFLMWKLAPAPGLVRDVLEGQFFGYEPITLEGVVKSLAVPIPAETLYESLKNPDSAPILAVMIGESLGVSANTYSTKGKPNIGTDTDFEAEDFEFKAEDFEFKAEDFKIEDFNF